MCKKVRLNVLVTKKARNAFKKLCIALDVKQSEALEKALLADEETLDKLDEINKE